MRRLLFRLFVALTLACHTTPSFAATYQMRILTSAALPDTTGNTWFEPAALSQTNDAIPQLVTRFKDSGTKTCVGTNFTVPQNYTSGGTFVILWASTATSGDVVWDVDYWSIAASGETFDPSTSYPDPLTVTTTAAGTSQIGSSSSMAVTGAGAVAAGDLIQSSVCRDGASASDTMAADAVVYAILFQYTGT